MLLEKNSRSESIDSGSKQQQWRGSEAAFHEASEIWPRRAEISGVEACKSAINILFDSDDYGEAEKL
jgi:hypothetical protein